MVDLPLAAKFTGLYRKLNPFWNDEAKDRLSEGRHPLSFELLTVVNSHRDHLNAVNYLARYHKPYVVLAGSGMCTGGRVVNYLKAMLGEARNDVLFVGYQAEGKPRRDILELGPQEGGVTLDRERFTIRAQVHQVSGYSAHGGQQDLINFAVGITLLPGQIWLTPGEAEAKAALQAWLKELLPGTDVVIAGEG
ncbi:MBL fold metallo-hydrolase RNA specificity domain-containing protein [Oceanisphaera sp. KMM 10153]|uniref:MBL fold metallo-hydrolase RNA specificity domain-containing protein n=1 Tax=Oceanisphaera submarina TaxID=3390193 RepID=UPI003975B495